MAKQGAIGVGVPADLTPRRTVAGTNSIHPSAIPGVPAGPINPNGGGGTDANGFNSSINIDGRQNNIFAMPYGKKKIIKRTFNLAGARAQEKHEIAGTVVWASFGSDPNAWIDVYLDDLSNDPIRFIPGSFISGVPFERLWVSNDVQAGETLHLTILTDRPLDRVDFR